MTRGTTPTASAQAPQQRPRRWLSRIGWLVAIWLASVLALGVVAYAFRILMGWVGLTR